MNGHDVTDHGPYEYDALDDYPDFCIPCAEAVAKNPDSLGIVLGGSGNGEQMAANKVKGVRVENMVHSADVVFCNSDIKPAYGKLLKSIPKPNKTLTQEPSSSAMIFYWGIKKKFPNLDLHNIFFSENYKNEFEHIFSNKTVCDDPTVYIHVSSKVVPEDAPES